MNETNPQIIDLEPPKRHGCLTTWLILLMIVNPIVAYLYITNLDAYSHLPDWFIPLMILFSLVNFAAALALFRWKKWGFWAMLGVNLTLFLINYMLVGFSSAATGLVSITILYVLLNIGGEIKAWNYLE